MMYRMIAIGLALVALQGQVPCLAQTSPAGVRDRAGLFSPEAARKADEALQTLQAHQRDHQWQVAVSGAVVPPQPVQQPPVAPASPIFQLILVRPQA